MLITFSGLDGAGKSTSIDWLRHMLERQNRRVTVLHLNDHVGVYACARVVRDRLLGPPPGANGKPRMEPLPTPLGRLRDAIVWSRALRRVVFPLDLLIFLGCRLWVEQVRRRVLIMDRYFYDRLVDVAQGGHDRWLRLFARLTPRPDLAVMLEISPEEAFARKGEYTVPYLRRRAEAYGRVFAEVPAVLRLKSARLAATRRALARALRARLHT